MLKLKGYLRPFALILALTVALLFLQAMCDLGLPNYMSSIVNIGIQQSGIEYAAPEAISEQGMEFILMFMSEGERELARESYELTPLSGDDGESLSLDYPNASEKLYVKKTLDDEVHADLENAFRSAAGTLLTLSSDTYAEIGAASQQGGEGASTYMDNVDINALYQMRQIVENSPELIDAAREKALSTTIESQLNQRGITLARMFYEELGADLAAFQTAYILRLGGVMLLIALTGGCATVMVNLLSSRTAAGVARNLRIDVFNKIESFSNTEFDKFSVASLITRCTNDITQIQMVLTMGIRMVCFSPIMAMGGLYMALRTSVSMSWIIALAVVVLISIIATLLSIATPKFKIIQKMVDRLNLVSRETLSGLMVIRAFGAQEHEQKRFEEANAQLKKTNLFINRTMTMLFPTTMLIMNITSVLTIWIGAGQIAASSLQIGNVMAYMQYATHVVMSFMMMSMTFVFIPRAAVSAERIAEVLNTEVMLNDPPNPVTFDASKKGEVEFENVCFRYQGAQEDSLSDITFSAPPGKMTAIIGSTGSGKSTIANLLLRFYDVTQGRILVDGVDVRDVAQKDLRLKIGYVPQKGALLSGTIGSNLKYGKEDATDEDIETAARIAQAIDFIDEKPDRFEAEIAQGGANVSGGQKQRLAIARALVKRPEILVFDDSFSALDFKTDAALRKALLDNTGDSTVIVVAQRVNTIMNADQIIVLENGRVVGRGTHRELLGTCPQYYEIAATQLSKEELA